MKIDNGYFQFLELERDYSHLWKLSHNRIFKMILKESPSLEVLIQYARSPKESIPQSEIFFYYGLRNAIKYAYILAKGFNIDVEDAIEESIIALYKMKQKGVPLANKYIYYKVYAIITRMSGLIYIPVHALESIRQVRKNVITLENKLRRLPTLREVSIFSDIPIKKVEHLLKVSRNPILFSELLDYYDDNEYYQDMSEIDALDELTMFINTTDTIEEQVFSTILKESLVKVLDKGLTPREREVMLLRYGILDGKERALEEVGKVYNVTRERIRQIEAKALRKLRNPKRSKKLKGFLDEQNEN